MYNYVRVTEVVTKGKKCIYVCVDRSVYGNDDPEILGLVQNIRNQAESAGLQLAEQPQIKPLGGKECWGVCVNWPPRAPTGLKINWPKLGSKAVIERDTTFVAMPRVQRARFTPRPARRARVRRARPALFRRRS